MIPKIIHYCWLSNDPLPADVQGYISTWKKHLKGYEFIKWDFNRFPKDKCAWVSEAFDCKKYAFAADYIRLYALYHYGGIYLDSDVEVLKSFDKLLDLDTMLCYENTDNGTIELEVAAFGVAKEQKWIGDCLHHYDNRHFITENGEMDMETLPIIVGKRLAENGYILKDVFNIEDALSTNQNEIPVFPFDFFSPKNLRTMEVIVTDNTYCIHNYKGSWSAQRLRDIFLRLGFRYAHAMFLAHYIGMPKRMLLSVIRKLKK